MKHVLEYTDGQIMAKVAVHLNLDGYTDLPLGKVASIVTYLEMRERPRLARAAKPEGLSLERLKGDVERYRALFNRIGEPWLWFGRAVISDAALLAIIGHPKVEAYVLTDGARDLGLLELDFRKKGEAELAYFGLVPEAVGKGVGRFMMSEAIRRAYAKDIKRFFVHTCTLDSPSALPFYIRSGFKPYKRAVEVADDPRLCGFLPLDVGPLVPILGKPQVKKASTKKVAAKKAATKKARPAARLSKPRLKTKSA
ncbi:GNAT family N-acetyltransferase [Microvirga flavescens]|uniref:GNAT family N-acetyltransferase n=1 Tax=Microvirga flavescens TaxID=2249811 RepID=UPI00315CA88D